MAYLCPENTPEKIGVAVSGGSDSSALLLLAADWAKETGCSLCVATVNHGLRAEAVDEAGQVASLCQSIEISHNTLNWTGWDGAGNLQGQARDARYRLFSQWAADNDVQNVLLGHTLDDQAETVLMRLARGSGVDGLSAMAQLRTHFGVQYLRPLLGETRADLRRFLADKGVVWIDDPSNENEEFDRIKARKALAALADLGIDAEGLSATAIRMQSAREALAGLAHSAAKQLVTVQAGAVFVETDGFFELAAETRRRLLAHLLNWVSGNTYVPRATSLVTVENALMDAEKSTLHGCVIWRGNGHIVVCREHGAVAEKVSDVSVLWDNRWKITGPETPGAEIRATGASGLAACPDWRLTDLPREVLLAAPSVWLGEKLLAAPLAGYAGGWRVEFTSRKK